MVSVFIFVNRFINEVLIMTEMGIVQAAQNCYQCLNCVDPFDNSGSSPCYNGTDTCIVMKKKHYFELFLLTF
jgi:hypothetical protein